MTETGRQLFIVEGVSLARQVLQTLLAAGETEGGGAQGRFATIEKLSAARPDTLILNLHHAEAPDKPHQEVHILNASLLSHILIVTGDVSDPRLFEKIRRLISPQPSLPQWMSSFSTSLRVIWSFLTAPLEITPGLARAIRLGPSTAKRPDPGIQ